MANDEATYIHLFIRMLTVIIHMRWWERQKTICVLHIVEYKDE